jgi:O-succinylbenzoic acid--CoA ligase
VPASLRPLSGTPAEVWAALRDWWTAPAGPVVVRTSGSTGAPKDVVLSAPALTASAQATLARLGATAADPGRWLLALPVTAVAGLQVLVRSLVGGTEPVLGAGDLVTAVDTMGPGRAFTALVPTQLHRLDRTGQLAVLARFDTVLLGGAPADPDLLDRAGSAGVRVVTTYGMSETCGGCVYDGVPLDGVEVRVGADGRVLVAGPVLFDGYADDPAATAAVLSDGWFRTEDLGRIDDEGRLEVVGRADDVVLTGGVSVHLGAVERALRSHPDVLDAVVVATGDDEWGSRVVAVVVPGASTPSLAQLRDHVAAVLPRSWAPRSLHVVQTLPLLPGGKVDRLAARALAAS